MQQLHLVGFTTDLEGLIFSARKGAKSGGYLVMLDDRLQATIEDALRLRNGDDEMPHDGADASAGGSRPRRPKPQSTLSPREIQARLRTGSSIAEVAAEAGVDEEWVGRFAAPILAEQAQVVARARRLVFEKPRLGTSALALGEAVRWNLADRDIRFLDDDFDAAWSAYNLQGTSWVVRFQYASRGKRQTAEWEVDLRENELFSRNRIASDLAYIDATRRRRRPPVLEPSPRETQAPAGSRREAPATAPPPAPTVAPAPRLATPATAGRGTAKAGASTPGKGARATSRATASKAATSSRRGTGGATTSSGTGGKAGSSPRRAVSSSRTAAAKPVGRAASKATAKATNAAKAAKATKAAKAGRATKATKAAKAAPPRRAATTAKKATKATKATGTRRAAATKRGRPAKAAAKKAGPEHRGTPPLVRAAATPPLDIAARRSHLARPASPMNTANAAPARGANDGFRVIGRDGGGRASLPPPRPQALAARARSTSAAERSRPTPADAPSRPRGDDGSRQDEAGQRRQPSSAGGALPDERRARRDGHDADRPRTAPAVEPPAPQAERSTPQAQRPRPSVERTPEASVPPAAASRQAAPPAAPAPGPAADRPTPEERLARRLAGRENGGDGRGARSRRARVDPVEPVEPVWHGPGSGEPAPAVRIRADMAAATMRPHEHAEPSVGPAPERPRRRRERPLRGR